MIALTIILWWMVGVLSVIIILKKTVKEVHMKDTIAILLFGWFGPVMTAILVWVFMVEYNNDNRIW